VNRARSAGDDPTPLSDALAAIGAELGLPAGSAMRDLEEHWSAVVGEDVAEHARLVSLRDGTLTITVDGPIWATQLRYLETAIIERANAVVGAGAVETVRVRVGDERTRE
jgi:predicted nucleic acid-binding Zn ribbon protein